MHLVYIIWIAFATSIPYYMHYAKLSHISELLYFEQNIYINVNIVYFMLGIINLAH